MRAEPTTVRPPTHKEVLLACRQRVRGLRGIADVRKDPFIIHTADLVIAALYHLERMIDLRTVEDR